MSFKFFSLVLIFFLIMGFLGAGINSAQAQEWGFEDGEGFEEGGFSEDEGFDLNPPPQTDKKKTQPAVVPPVQPKTPSKKQETAAFQFTTELYSGMQYSAKTKDEVKRMQEFLRDQGFYPSSQGVTGVFGAVTETSLKKFQGSKGLAQTGRLDSATRAVINEIFSGVADDIILKGGDEFGPEEEPVPAVEKGKKEKGKETGEEKDMGENGGKETKEIKGGMRGGIQAPSAPEAPKADLLILDYGIEPNPPVAGQQFNWAFVISNKGKIKVDDGYLEAKVYILTGGSGSGGLDKKDYNIVDLSNTCDGLDFLSPGAKCSVVKGVLIEKPGRYVLYAVVDPKLKLLESDEGNNIIQTSFEVVAPQTKESFVLGYQLGDVNRDGKVTVADAILIKKFIAGTEGFSQEQMLLADMDKDAWITEKDVALISPKVNEVPVESLPKPKGPPDLTVEKLEFPKIITEGGSVVFYASARNKGEDVAGANKGVFYVDFEFLSEHDTAVLWGNSSQGFESKPWKATAGVHEVFFCADAYKKINEKDEENNCFWVKDLKVEKKAEAVKVKEGADLVVTSLSIDPPSIQPDKPFVVRVTVKNQGDDTASGFDIALNKFHSTKDGSVDTARLGSYNTGYAFSQGYNFRGYRTKEETLVLKPGEEFTDKIPYNTPNSIGAYCSNFFNGLSATADPGGSVKEAKGKEANNTSSIQFNFAADSCKAKETPPPTEVPKTPPVVNDPGPAPAPVSGGLPDLVAGPVTKSSIIDPPTEGFGITFSSVIRNQGSGASAPAKVSFCDFWNGDCFGEYDLPTLKPGTSVPLESKAWTAKKGDIQIVVCADMYKKVTDSDRSNNCESLTFNVVEKKIEKKTAPNLVVENIIADPVPVDLSKPLTLTFKVKNRGDAPASGFDIKAYRQAYVNGQVQYKELGSYKNGFVFSNVSANNKKITLNPGEEFSYSVKFGNPRTVLELYCMLNGAKVSYFGVKAEINPESSLQESNVSDNTFSVPLYVSPSCPQTYLNPKLRAKSDYAGALWSLSRQVDDFLEQMKKLGF